MQLDDKPSPEPYWPTPMLPSGLTKSKPQEVNQFLGNYKVERFQVDVTVIRESMDIGHSTT